MAERLIAYKQKMSEEWLEKKSNENKNDLPCKGDTSDEKSTEQPIQKINQFYKRLI
jgi:hypothetical protein